MNSRKIESDMISRMSVQSLKSDRMRNLFVMAAIGLASALLTAILMFAAGQGEQTKRELSHRQQVSYYNLTPGQADLLEKDERIACQIRVKTGTLSGMDGFDVMPYYVSELTDEIRIAELETGRLPEAENEIALQAALLAKMNVEPAIGGNVTFTFYDGSTESFTVSGLIKGNGAAKQFPVFFSEGYAQSGSQLKEKSYEVHARLYGADSMYPDVCKETMYQIGSDAGIERKYISPSKPFLDSLSVDTSFVILYGLVGAVILSACVLVIYGVFYLSVVGRIHQSGQLRTLGMTRRQMKKFISREGGILFLRSAPVGIATGAVAGYFMIPDGFDIANTLLIAVLIFLSACLITMVSVHRPARLASLVSPMEAIRYVPQERMKKEGTKRVCRTLTPLGLGLMNFSKNRKKAAVTFISLSLGGIIFMTAAAYMSSFDKENFARQGYFTDAEFQIHYSSSAIELNENGESGLQAHAPLDQELLRQISSLDGVKQIGIIKGFPVSYDYPQHDNYNDMDIVYPLTEEETAKARSYLEDGSADYEKLMSGDYLLVGGNSVAMEVYGWKFAVGDTITLHYYDGSQKAEKEVTILGILNAQYTLDHKGLQGWFLMPEQAISEFISYGLATDLLISSDAEKEEALGEQLTELIADKTGLAMETLAERRVIYAQNADQLFGAISGLAIFIMMFSILSMINTLITNIVTRKQELAMLESIGMSRGQIRKMLLGESLLLILATVGMTMTIGTVCGYALCRILCRAGAFYMKFRFPAMSALAYAAVLILVPLIITFLSMHSFSREALVERLRGTEN